MLENFDVERAVAITRTMEQTCGRGELPLLPTALTQLQDDMEALSRALRRYTRTLREEILHDGGRGEPTHIVHRAR
jgi:hypothetical protein